MSLRTRLLGAPSRLAIAVAASGGQLAIRRGSLPR